MTPEEIKSMMDQSAAEIKSLKETIDSKETEIANLDASIQDQQKSIEELTKEVKAAKAPKTMKEAFAAAFSEKANEINNFVKSAKDGDKMTIEVKLDSNITNGAVYGAVAENGVNSTPNLPNAFLANLPVDNVPGVNIAWLEGSYTSNAAYVAELAAVASDDTATVTEKHRAFGKLAAHICISSEVNDFLGQVYSWATGEAIAKIEKKADEEILAGAGADTTAPRKVYGLKGQAAAFTALGKYATPNLADVIKDSTAQIRKGGFTANQAYVSYTDLPTIEGLKDANGNYLYNQLTGYLGQCKIIPSAALATKQMLIVDSSIARIKRQPLFEFEVERNAAKDGYDCYVRRGYQALIKAGDTAGAVWVADTDAAITAITK